MTSATCKGYAINVIIKNRGAKPTKTRRKMNSEKKAIIGSFAASLILAAIAIAGLGLIIHGNGEDEE